MPTGLLGSSLKTFALNPLLINKDGSSAEVKHPGAQIPAAERDAGGPK